MAQPPAPRPPAPHPPTLPTPRTPEPSPAGEAATAGGRPARRKALLIGLVLALLLGAGGWALWSFTGGGSPGGGKQTADGKNPAPGSVAWKAEARTAPDQKFTKAMGTWFTSSLVVKAEPDMVTAYDIKTGRKKWSFILTGRLCAASRESEGDVVVVAAMFGKSCIDLKAIDLRDGHRLWNELLVEEREADDHLNPDKWGKAEPRLSLNAGHVYMTWAEGSQTRRLSDGKRVAQEKHAPCEWSDAAGGDRLIAVDYCGTRDITVRSLDPANLAKPRWTTTLPRNDGFVSIISTSPLVLTQSPGKGGPDDRYDFVVLDPAGGREKTRIAYNGYWRLGPCFLSTSGCTGALTDKNSLYVAGQGVTMAYDLSTGRPRWTYKADANRVTIPVAVHDGQVAAYTTATPQRPGRTTFVSASDGKARRTVEHSDRETDRKNEAMMAKVTGFPRLRDDRLLLVNDGNVPDRSGVVLAVAVPGGSG
ncbi:PQQ-binding-like beta-propeller repeat protein [Streptomyces sp. NPDC049577]|uniref:outer membrane protein assembly factor BamB family protein n=1 Tax=Streptomyces sp. NPDC049577 TaxID=3155153 RepID=UPI00342A39C0